MAKIVSPVWSSISGSIAGTTYFTTPAGAIIARQRVKPVNPSSPLQTVIRGALTVSNAVWESLTQAVRDSWDAYAMTVSAFKTGRQAFIAGYSFASYMNSTVAAGNVLIEAAPLSPTVLSVSSVTMDGPSVPGNGVSVSWTNTETDPVDALVEISPPFNATRNFWKGPWLTGDNQLSADAVGGATTVVDFLDLTVGQKYFIRLRAVMNDTPLRRSAIFYSSGLASTNP